MQSFSSSTWCGSRPGSGDDHEDPIVLDTCFQDTLLLGFPAIAAILSFVARAAYLRRRGIAHGKPTYFGYWPSQLALVAAVGILGGHLLLGMSSSPASYFAVLSLLVAWILAIHLNNLEKKYEIRSSSAIFAFELYAILASSLSLYSAQRNDSNSFHFPVMYMGAIATAFFFEAFPRGGSQVQTSSDASYLDKANLFSRWVFHYIQPVISLGVTRPLTLEDIDGTLPKTSTAESGYTRLSVHWNVNRRTAEVSGTKPSLLKVILIAFRSPLTYMTLYQGTASILQFLHPLLMKHILMYIESEDSSLKVGVLLALGMFLVSMTTSILLGQYNHVIDKTGLEIRGGLTSMVYRKALVLSPGARKNASAGEMTNHLSNDAEKWNQFLYLLPFWITIPLEIVIATVMLYNLLGWSSLCGLVLILVLTPVQGKVAGFFEDNGGARYAAMDKRVELMTEILSNIKIIKLYGYEAAFKTKVESFRATEIKLMKKSGIVMSFLSIIFTCLPLIMALVCFSVYATVGGPNFTPGDINAQVVFVSLSLFSLLEHPVGIIARVIECSIGIRVATGRIQKFLLKEEIDSNTVQRESVLPKDLSAPVITVDNATFAWDPEHSLPKDDEEDESEEATETTALLSQGTNETDTSAPTLMDINLAIQRASLTAIVGRVGQGKSSLLCALIGDMYKRQGHIAVHGRIAYVPQQAWVVNATLRDNIVFGKAFDQERYDRILFASGLLPDIEILAAGDQTEIGERGINLSGGQKQRVSLARAAYQDADIYLLDDPLSAVDAHVDQHLWENLIGPYGLLKEKTRLLVTHGIHHLHEVNHILVVKDGRIAETGPYDQLMKAKDAFYHLIKDYSVSHSRKKQHSSSSSSTSDDEETGTVVVEDSEKNKKDGDGELVEDEEVQDTVVGLGTFKVYCEAMSYRYFITILVLFALWEAFQLGVPVWLEYWIRVSDSTDHSVAFFLTIYAVLVFAYMVVDVVVTYLSTVLAGVRASEVLQRNLLERVLRLPMSFFDTTPQGRVLNRFSGDIASIDERVPDTMTSVLAGFFNLFGIIAILAVATPPIVLALPVVAILYFALQNYYLRTSSVLKRLASTSMSPLHQHFAETLNGISSIRAMDLKDRFIDENIIRSDRASNAEFTSLTTNRWLNMRLESITSVMVLVASLLAVFNKGKLTPSLAGLALSSTTHLTHNVVWSLRSYCDFQSDLVAVERVHDYSQRNTEAPNHTGVDLPALWPQHGRIAFKNYSTRYREGLDLVIKDVSFEVEPSQKIGIVGRTGAGKSSLTLALFRLVEAADSYWARSSAQPTELLEAMPSGIDGGSIEIDGIDISTLGLQDLRRHLAIIPQDPTLFQGTIRENLDPFNEMEDAELWMALERAHLKSHISSLSGGLSFEVSQNGDNFSVGQRSLICLARALLRKTKVLILDEATAAVDVETDELIQKTIRTEFKDRTILTIAHRIKTIMDSDKVLVLEKGRVEEYDTPSQLLRRQGLFYNLAEQAGEVAH